MQILIRKLLLTRRTRNLLNTQKLLSNHIFQTFLMHIFKATHSYTTHRIRVDSFSTYAALSNFHWKILLDWQLFLLFVKFLMRSRDFFLRIVAFKFRWIFLFSCNHLANVMVKEVKDHLDVLPVLN